MNEDIKGVGACIFDIIVFNLFFIPVAAVTFGFMFLPLYGVIIAALIRAHYLGNVPSAFMCAFRTFKNNFVELMIHNIFNLLALTLLFIFMLRINDQFYLLSIVILFLVVTFEVIFWYVLCTRQFGFFGYYKFTSVIMFKYLYFSIVVILFLGILGYIALNGAFWLFIFFPFGWTYPLVLFYASKIKKFVKLSESTTNDVMSSEDSNGY